MVLELGLAILGSFSLQSSLQHPRCALPSVRTISVSEMRSESGIDSKPFKPLIKEIQKYKNTKYRKAFRLTLSLKPLYCHKVVGYYKRLTWFNPKNANNHHRSLLFLLCVAPAALGSGLLLVQLTISPTLISALWDHPTIPPSTRSSLIHLVAH